MRVHIVTDADIPAYRRAVIASQDRLRPWNPVNPGDLVYHLRMQCPTHRTFLIRATRPSGDHDVVGKVNVTNIVRGRAFSASMGYDSYDPYAGTGLFAQGLRLVVDIALAPEPDGLGLYRVEASTQPANTRSAGLLRRLGFRPRGDWPEYLWLADGQGREAWRDHITYGMTRAQWPAPAYAPRLPARPVLALRAPAADLNAPEVLGRAHALAIELAVPVVRDSGDAACLRERLFDAVSGAVVISPRPTAELVTELMAARITAPVIASVQTLDGAGAIVRLALQARAAAGVDDA